VWHYTTTFDTPVPGAGVLSCAWHTADLPLAFRAVYYAHGGNLSRIIAHGFAAFARTGDPNTAENPWRPFMAEHKETMLFDLIQACVNDPYRDIYHILSSVSPTFKGGFAV
jgi:para-nitrobenzyl esterase